MEKDPEIITICSTFGKNQLNDDLRTLGMTGAKIEMGLHAIKDIVETSTDYSNTRNVIMTTLNEILSDWSEFFDQLNIMKNWNEQQKFLNSLEVIGLPESLATDFDGVVLTLSRLLRIRIDTEYIVGFQRIGPKPEGDCETANPRSLLVHLANQNIRNRLLHVADYKQLTIPGSDRPIRVTEHLTFTNKQILNKTRQEAMRLNFDYVWVMDGKIFVRRGKTSTIHQIRCDADIQNMARY